MSAMLIRVNSTLLSLTTLSSRSLDSGIMPCSLPCLEKIGKTIVATHSNTWGTWAKTRTKLNTKNKIEKHHRDKKKISPVVLFYIRKKENKENPREKNIPHQRIRQYPSNICGRDNRNF